MQIDNMAELITIAKHRRQWKNWSEFASQLSIE